MAFLTNAGNLAARKRILAGKMDAGFRKAAQLHAVEMKRIAVELSSGTQTTKALRAKGSPYARRLPSGSAGMPDYIVNSQTDAFRKGWRTRVTKSNNRWTISIWNDSDHARYMLGTLKMRKRDVLMVVIQRTNPRFHDAVEREIRRGIKENAVQDAPVTSSASVSASSRSSGSSGGLSSGGGYSALGAFTAAVTGGLSAVGGAVFDGVNRS